MGKHRPAPSRHRPAAGATLAATAAMVIVPLTGEMPAAQAHVAKTSEPPATATDTVVIPTPAPAPTPVPVTHVVQRGDTLSAIGAVRGVPWRELAAANNIQPPFTIFVGQVLRVPTSGSLAPAQPVQEVTEIPAPVSASTTASRAVLAALSRVGTPYVFGGVGPTGFDCSGLVQYAYAKAGLALPRTSSAQARAGTPVSRADLRPGDLVAYYSPVSHIGIYVGNGKVVQAPTSGDVVRVESLTWAGQPTALRRVS